MNLEFSDGRTETVSDVDGLRTRLSALADGAHVILSDDDLFMQMARTGDDVAVQWGDGRTLHESDRPMTMDDAVSLFASFFVRDDRWRRTVVWTDVTNAPRAGDSTSHHRASFTGEGLLDDVAGAFKRKARTMIRRGLRRFLP